MPLGYVCAQMALKITQCVGVNSVCFLPYIFFLTWLPWMKQYYILQLPGSPSGEMGQTLLHTPFTLLQTAYKYMLVSTPNQCVLWQSLGKTLDCMNFNFAAAEPFWDMGLGSTDKYAKVREARTSEILLLLWPQAEQSLHSPLFPNSTSLESVAQSGSEDCYWKVSDFFSWFLLTSGISYPGSIQNILDIQSIK